MNQRTEDSETAPRTPKCSRQTWEQQLNREWLVQPNARGEKRALACPTGAGAAWDATSLIDPAIAPSSKEPRGKLLGVDSQRSRTGTLRTRESPDESGHVGLSQAAPDSTLPGVSTSHERRREVWSAGGAVLKPATFQEFRKTHFT